jgi:hypothetical protein
MDQVPAKNWGSFESAFSYPALDELLLYEILSYRTRRGVKAVCNPARVLVSCSGKDRSPHIGRHARVSSSNLNLLHMSESVNGIFEWGRHR